MKKLFIILGAAALVLASCAKSETVVKETPGEISFKAITGAVTKADVTPGSGPEISNATFATDNVLMISASTKEQPNYFGGTAGLSFTHEVATGLWVGSTKQYWPAGQQRVDFLAYATKNSAVLGVTPAFDATRPADMLTVENWDVYTNQVDFIYAAANNKYKDDVVSPVAMQFQHSTALMIFNFKVSEGPSIKIVSIDFDALDYQGTFRVDNTKTSLSTRWYGQSTDVIAAITPGSGLVSHNKTQFPATAATIKSGYNDDATGLIGYGTAGTAAWQQLNETFLVIPQERQSFLITYKIGTDDTLYTFHCDMNKGEWEAGKIYIYNIDFNLREIKVQPTVKDWEKADNMPEVL